MSIGPFEMVVGIVLIGTVGSIVKARYGLRENKHGEDVPINDPALIAENGRLRDELRSIKERVQVLERVITDEESSSKRLDREIERLRDKNSV